MRSSLEFRVLKQPREFEDFSSRYMASFGGKKLHPKQAVSVDHLVNCKRVMGVYKKGELVAGFVINDYPRRSLEYVSPPDRESIIQDLGGENQVCELVAIWRSNSISKFSFICKVWSKIVFDTLAQKRPFIFGCAYKGHGMKKTYYLMKPKTVCEGKDSNDLNAFYFTRKQFLWTFLLSLIPGLLRECYRSAFRRRQPSPPLQQKV